MKKLLLLIAAAGITGSALAVETPVYSSIAGPYAAFGARTGMLGYDDYTCSPNPGFTTISSMQFVGGVAVGANLTTTNMQVLFFAGADTARTTVLAGFTLALNQAGNFIWTIGPPLGIVIPTFGIMEIDAVGTNAAGTGGNTGQWFLTTTAPSVGSNSSAYGYAASQSLPQYNQAFSLSTPEPATWAVMGLGLAGILARRRRK